MKPMADWQLLPTRFLKEQQEPKIPGSYDELTSRQAAGRVAGNTRSGREFRTAIATQGRATSLGNPAASPSHNLPHLLCSSQRPTRWAASLCLPRVIHLPASLPNLTQPTCLQTSIIPVSPSFVDTPRRPGPFSQDRHRFNTSM